MTFKELQAAVAAKCEQLAAILAEAGDDYDMSKVTLIAGTSEEKVREIQRRDAEITDLRGQLAEMQKLATVSANNGDLIRQIKTGGGEPGATGPRPTDGRGRESKSLGELFTASPAFTEYNRTAKRSPVADIPYDLSPRATVLDEAGGYAPQAVRTGLILPAPLQPPTIADLIPQGATAQTAVVFMEETTTTNAAASVAEKGAKPESALAFTERSAAVRKIATVLPITDELMADEPAMRSYVEARMLLFLRLAEEAQLYNGSGTAPDIQGILGVSGINVQAKGADPAPDAIFKALTKVQTTSYLNPSAIVMHPTDWQNVRLLQTSDGIYIWGSPADSGPARMWGLPVVTTTNATLGTALVGAFDMAAQIFRKAEVSFAISDQHNDFFVKNQLMLRVEERLALAIYRPNGFAKVTGL